MNIIRVNLKSKSTKNVSSYVQKKYKIIFEVHIGGLWKLNVHFLLDVANMIENKYTSYVRVLTKTRSYRFKLDINILTTLYFRKLQ